MSCPLCNKNHAYSIDEALKSLAGTPRRLDRLAQGFNAKQASARPAPGKWSAKEIVCHLADCELVYGLRYRMIISEPHATLMAFDQEAWAKHLQYREQPMKSALACFKVLRAGDIALLKSLPRSAWNKGGQHPSYGALTLRQIVTHLVDHDRNHVAAIERLAAR
ncbi:MAG: DinB family protein [Acidobacteriia bacterium]|nr:DinB family protein [Terriglobia bacterium]